MLAAVCGILVIMTVRERLSVLLVLVVGLVPAFATYEYVLDHPVIPISGAGISSDVSGLDQTAAVGATATVYQSQPLKEREEGVCKNSYYGSLLLTVSREGSVTLLKRCESARDESVTWKGQLLASSTADGTKLQQLSLRQDATGETSGSFEVVLEASIDGNLRIVSTTLAEVATTTVFVRVPFGG